MNIVYMPAGRMVWQDVSKKFYEKSMYPKIWLGDPVHDEYAKHNYKDCLVLDFYGMHKVISKEKSKLNLAFNFSADKYFYMLKDQVYKMMDRQDDFGGFGRLEREAFFYSLFFYFHTIVIEKNIEVLVASEGPHSPVSMILYGVCKILGIKTYHLEQNSITPVAHISTDFYGSKIKLSNGYDYSKHTNVMSKYVSLITDDIPSPYYMENQKKFDRKADGCGFKFNKYIARPFKNYIFKRNKEHGYSVYRRDFFKDNHRPLLYENIIAKRKKELFFEHESYLSRFSFEQSFVYVPLHYEPEKTSNPDGGEFYNAYDMIMWLRSFVPDDIVIVLKEHYSQFTNKMYGYRGRSPLFYHAISALHNVVFIDITIPSSELIKRSVFVATQTGSAALEASLMQKKSLVFGAPWFIGAPNIFSYKSIINFDDFSKQEVFEKVEVEKYLLSYISDYTIPACVNPSGESGFKIKFGDFFDELIDDEFFATALTDIIYKDFINV